MRMLHITHTHTVNISSRLILSRAFCFSRKNKNANENERHTFNAIKVCVNCYIDTREHFHTWECVFCLKTNTLTCISLYLYIYSQFDIISVGESRAQLLRNSHTKHYRKIIFTQFTFTFFRHRLMMMRWIQCEKDALWMAQFFVLFLLQHMKHKL